MDAAQQTREHRGASVAQKVARILDIHALRQVQREHYPDELMRSSIHLGITRLCSRLQSSKTGLRAENTLNMGFQYAVGHGSGGIGIECPFLHTGHLSMPRSRTRHLCAVAVSDADHCPASCMRRVSDSSVPCPPAVLFGVDRRASEISRNAACLLCTERIQFVINVFFAVCRVHLSSSSSSSSSSRRFLDIPCQRTSHVDDRPQHRSVLFDSNSADDATANAFWVAKPLGTGMTSSTLFQPGSSRLLLGRSGVCLNISSIQVRINEFVM